MIFVITIMGGELLFTIAGVGLLDASGSRCGGLIFGGAWVELDGDGSMVFDEGFDRVSSLDFIYFLRYIDWKDCKWLSGME